jgi:hypothetical protein
MKQQLMLVAMLSVGTALTTMGRIKPVAASITPPATYDYSYTWNAGASEQYLNVNGVDSIPLYTRTADGVYFNYISTFNVIDDLLVTQTFNRSNTTWQASGTFYKPDQDKIGSDNTVGTVTNKTAFSFINNTNKDYLLYFDASSSPTYTAYTVTNTLSTFVLYVDGAVFHKIILPSYSSFTLGRGGTSQANYFDAWYLQDLGISDSYQAGLDAETDGILTDYLGTDAQQIGWVLIGIAAILFAFKGGK